MRAAVTRKAHEYILKDGKKPYSDWLLGLRDKRAAAKIVTAVRKMEAGNFGDSEPIGEGVSENKLHYGPGYRVYYALDGRELVVLLCGGDKSTQQADINQARVYWADYLERKKLEKPKATPQKGKSKRNKKLKKGMELCR